VDPSATAGYELVSGALVWSDETPDGAFSHPLKCVLAYRTSILLGRERTELRPQWEQLTREAPNWPGFRPERLGDEARRLLLELQEE
jgi:hypothetical protein